MVLTFSIVVKLFLKLRGHSTREPSEDSSSDETSPAPLPSSPTVPSTIPSSTPPVHNLSTTAVATASPLHSPTAPTISSTPLSTPNSKRNPKRFSQGTPMSHSKSYTSPGSLSSLSAPSSPHYRSFSEPVSPSSLRSPTKQKPQRTETKSGSEPLSHLGLAETACERRELVERTDTYLCAGGVNTLILLRMTRADLMDTVSLLGANALIEEQWRCTIYGPKNKATYKVQIHYRAYGTRSTMPDPHQPVAVDQTHSIPGLMTILRRNDD